MKEASFYTKMDDGKVRCLLCPHQCIIKEGRLGICRVRRNKGGLLYAESYGMVSAIHSDPIEKKPLYHFFPGSYILSVGSVGCNLSCIFCQNCEISQVTVEEYPGMHTIDPSGLIVLVSKQPGNIGLAYTYNEPFISYELIRDTAPLIKEKGKYTAMVTNGFMEEVPLRDLLQFIDAFNVDLKGFTEAFYRKFTRSRLSPVLRTLKQIRKSGVHLELTNLVIPGANDDESVFRSMISWIENELGKDTVLHLSRYFPRYKLTQPPTPSLVLHTFYDIARSVLNYVYVGNIDIPGTQDTFCPKCSALLIQRSGYQVSVTGLDDRAFCRSCGYNTGIKL